MSENTNAIKWHDLAKKLDAAINQILDDQPNGLSLYELIRFLSTQPHALFDKQALTESVSLFQTNFVVMNALYRIKQAHPLEDIEISSLKIIRQPKISSENNSIEIQDPLAEYYLNWDNFDTTEDDVQTLMNSFWEKLLHIDFKEDDLKLLGAEGATTLAEIKACYRRKSQNHHPDKGGDPEIFLEIKAAYDRLSNHAL